MPEVTMPRLSDTMQEGTITRWLKKSGDAVKRGDILAEVETDKANMEIESYDTGILEQILVKEGETAPIGQPIALIGSGQGSAQQSASSVQTKSASAQAQATTSQASAATSGSTPMNNSFQPLVTQGESFSTAGMQGQNGARIKASPLARRIAEEHNIDLRQIQGSGPGGRIVRDDLASHIQAAPTATAATVQIAPEPQPQPVPTASGVSYAPDDEVINPSQMQKTVARRLTESKTTVPHFYVRNEIDMTAVLAMRQALNASAGEGGVKISVNDLIVKACALALEKFPEVNSSWKENQIIRHAHVNIGIAVDVPNGLIVPVIRDANIKGVRTIAKEAKALIEKARNNKLGPNDYTGGTFSVSNLGMMDVTDFSAIINPPEAAILAVASTRKTFVPIDGQPVIRDIMPTTLSADHRILYGATVARFLQEVKRLLQDPYALLG
ncbi:MAG TPA: pyruvate dehydrogenase complex dihydrolipoamide acetyltransferase [Ktedonobacteraceae bacterium]|nr:pyruvate dehydrogenase complex dihydrolipoamide acetyltransferase [Ktedonobacteraceae bacterium]